MTAACRGGRPCMGPRRARGWRPRWMAAAHRPAAGHCPLLTARCACRASGTIVGEGVLSPCRTMYSRWPATRSPPAGKASQCRSVPRMGASPPWEVVTGPPEAVTWGLVPLEADDGAMRPVMLVAWVLDDQGAVLVQPVVRGEDDPLPWGLRTRAFDPPPGGRPEDGIAAYRDLVLPMVLAVEALLARGLAPDEVARRGGEACAMAAMAHEARRGMRDLPTG